MKHLVILSTMLAAGFLSLSPAVAQVPAQPNYEQALTPQAVREVQQRLHRLGYYGGPADGIWGARSRTALERFQGKNKLQVTGELNSATVMAMGLNPNDLVARGNGSTSPPGIVRGPEQSQAARQPLAPAAVRTVQQRLQQLGFYSGAADGVWGQGTETALVRFQQYRGLQVTGRLDPATTRALGFNPNGFVAQGVTPPPDGFVGRTGP